MTNFLLFMPDQMRADAIGPLGAGAFSNAFAQHSVCGPSRISMFTGWCGLVRRPGRAAR